MLSGTWLEAQQPWSLRGSRKQSNASWSFKSCWVKKRHGYEKLIHWCRRQKPHPWSTGAQCCLKRFSMDGALCLLQLIFDESWCDVVEKQEWSALNASKAEGIFPKMAKEKRKYPDLFLATHHTFNMLKLRPDKRTLVRFQSALGTILNAPQGSTILLLSSSLGPRGSINRLPGCLHRSNPGKSR